MEIHLRINDNEAEVNASPGETLLTTLRGLGYFRRETRLREWRMRRLYSAAGWKAGQLLCIFNSPGGRTYHRDDRVAWAAPGARLENHGWTAPHPTGFCGKWGDLMRLLYAGAGAGCQASARSQPPPG